MRQLAQTWTWRTAGHQGTRSVNADAVASRGLVVALADGVGDSVESSRAALLAATAAVSVPAVAGVAAALVAACDAVRASSAGDAVLAVVQPCGDGFRVGWVGDVRVYAWDGVRLRQLTTDHTLAQYFRDRGEPVVPRMEHLVTTSVRTAVPERFGQASCSTRDGLVLTTDGVHKVLSHDAMVTVLRSAASPAAALVSAAARAGGHDNATAVVVEYLELPPTKPLPVAA